MVIGEIQAMLRQQLVFVGLLQLQVNILLTGYGCVALFAFSLAYKVLQYSSNKDFTFSNSSCTSADSGKNFINDYRRYPLIFMRGKGTKRLRVSDYPFRIATTH